jgi:TonB family protein
MSGALTDTPANLAVPTFGTVEGRHENWRHLSGVAAASLAVHIILAMAAVTALRMPVPVRTFPQIEIDTPSEVTKLVAPPAALTQKAPNTRDLSKEFNLSSLPPRPAQRGVPATPGAAALPKQKFSLPEQRDQARVPSSALAEAPALDLRPSATPPPRLGIDVPAPPPQIEPQEPPKLAFERPGVPRGTTGTTGLGNVNIPRPAGTVAETLRQMSRSSGAGLIVGDEDGGGPASSPSAAAVPIPGKLGSSVELLSDPMGVDFWPYLVRVLSAVRRNWFSVIPESARLGRQGRTVIQFAIGRDGSVPKLVIATPSGTDALDRAAVAGISASNPFPPLPAEFKGGQIRLQFVFKYNVR